MVPDKKALRRLIRAGKQAMSQEDIRCRSQILCRKVLESDTYRSCSCIYGYLPFNQEVRTQPLLEQALRDGKTVALPKCCGQDMSFLLVDDLSRIQYSSFGVPEPLSDAPPAQDPHALVLLPGLAFDRSGYRLGYGGGYYDRFLAREPEHPTIALCFDFQIVDCLPVQPHDIPADTLFWV